MALLALRALLTDSKLDLGPDMVEAGLPRLVSQRQQQVLPAVLSLTASTHAYARVDMRTCTAAP